MPTPNDYRALWLPILLSLAVGVDPAVGGPVGGSEPAHDPSAAVSVAVSDEDRDSVSEAQYQFALAQALRFESDYAGAREAFEAAVSIEPDDPFLRLTFAEFLYQLGELEEARIQASASRRLDAQRTESLRLLARIEMRQADKSSEAVDNALRLFAELARLLPDDLESRVSSGRLLMSLARFDEAAVVLGEAYELRPDDVRVASLLLGALQALDDPVEAEDGLRSLLERFPEWLEARLALAGLLSEQGRHGDAAAVLQQATSAQLQTVEVLRVLTLELYRIGAWEQALEASETWLEQAPEEAPARYLNALGLSALARYTEAETVLRGLLDEDGGSFDVARVLAEVIERQGRPEEASELLAEAAAALERDGESDLALRARLELVDLQVRTGNWPRALELVTDLQASDPRAREPELELIRGQALLEVGRAEEAIALFSALSANPEVAGRARASEAEALFRAGETERAELKMAELAASDDAEQIVLMARALHRLELYERAIPFWLRAKAENPDALEIRFWLGSAYERSGSRDPAIREFRDLLERDELFAPALNYLGYMWAEQGENLPEAVTLVERAVSLEPNNGAYVDSLGWAHYQLGNYEEARDYLEKAARLVGDDAVVFEHLGDLYRALGQRTLAAQSYQRALALADDNQDAVRRKLEELNGDS